MTAVRTAGFINEGSPALVLSTRAVEIPQKISKLSYKRRVDVGVVSGVDTVSRRGQVGVDVVCFSRHREQLFLKRVYVG